MMMSAWRGSSAVVGDGFGEPSGGIMADWTPGGEIGRTKVPTKEQWKMLLTIMPKGPINPLQKCCPSLLYPKTLSHPTASATSVINGRIVSDVRVGFTFEANYDNDPPKPGCACVCCEFVQVIVKNSMVFTCPGLPPTVTNEHEGEEDVCEYLVYDLKGNEWTTEYHERGWVPRGRLLEGKGKGVFWDGPYCYGDRERPEAPPKTRKGVAPQEPKPGQQPGPGMVPPKSRVTPCKVTSEDFPGTLVAGGCTFKWEWESWGVVYDICKQLVKRVGYVTWNLEVTVPNKEGVPVPLKEANVSGSKGDVNVNSSTNGGMSGAADEGPAAPKPNDGAVGGGK
jgi:hypothetical protein